MFWMTFFPEHNLVAVTYVQRSKKKKRPLKCRSINQLKIEILLRGKYLKICTSVNIFCYIPLMTSHQNDIWMYS